MFALSDHRPLNKRGTANQSGQKNCRPWTSCSARAVFVTLTTYLLRYAYYWFKLFRVVSELIASVVSFFQFQGRILDRCEMSGVRDKFSFFDV